MKRRRDTLTPVFSALGDPTRRAILERLREGEATVGELAEPFAMSQPAVSRHLRVLEDAGLIARRTAGTARYSRLEGRPLAAASMWLQGYEEFWPRGYGDALDPIGSDEEWVI